MKLNKWFIGLYLIFVAGIFSCGERGSQGKTAENHLIVFHAGSLTKPFHEMAKAFEAENPGSKIILEAAGSRDCARKITELHKACDVIAVSDYAVTETLLIPEFTNWQIAFAGNEMCIAYNSSSRQSNKINSKNWFDILLKDSVYFARSEPESDPCGYRTDILLQLAESFYGIGGLSEQLKQKDTEFIRPKEVDLLALLESYAIDYIFIYTSVARQHQLKIVELPDEINLSNPSFADFYSTAGVELSGKSKNEKIIQKGEPILYGISILKSAPNKALAEKFVIFLLTPDKGMKILEDNGQQTLVDTASKYTHVIPELIKTTLKIKT